MTDKQKKELIFPKCEICGYKTVTRHRLRPGRKGGKYVPWNVIGLCPNCHSEAENGTLSPYTIQNIILGRIKLHLNKK